MLGWLAGWLAGCMYIYARTHINLKSGRREEQEEVKREEEGGGRAGNALARLEAFTFLCIENRKNAEPSSANKLAWTWTKRRPGHAYLPASLPPSAWQCGTHFTHFDMQTNAVNKAARVAVIDGAIASLAGVACHKRWPGKMREKKKEKLWWKFKNLHVKTKEQFNKKQMVNSRRGAGGQGAVRGSANRCMQLQPNMGIRYVYAT